VSYSIVVCAGLVPDPLQTLEPIETPQGPALKNEMMLPAVLDNWAFCALVEAGRLAKNVPGSKIYLVSMAPKAKLQQVMMTVAQKVPFELVSLDGPASGFADASHVAAALAEAIEAIPDLARDRLLLFGGWESASRSAGVTLAMVGERLGIRDQFQGVDELDIQPDGRLRILERVEGGQHQVSLCAGPPAVLGWATGSLPEPPNNPQIGMTNMRLLMPALQKARQVPKESESATFSRVSLPAARRATRVVKDMTPEEIARELVAWIGGEAPLQVTEQATSADPPTTGSETLLFLAPTRSDGTLARASLEALSAARNAARAQGTRLVAGLYGEKVEAAANQIAGCGAALILGISSPELAQPRYGTDAAAAEALARQAGADLILAPDTSRTHRVMAGVAHRLGGAADTHVTGISDSLEITRGYYRQRMEATLSRTRRPWVILVEPGCYEAWDGEGGTAQVQAVPLDLAEADRRTSVEGLQAPASSQATVRPEADLLFVAGAGWTKPQKDGRVRTQDAEKLILDFLQLSEASLGGSKSLVDLGQEGQESLSFMTHLNQVGQTGSSPRHLKGLSTCCHGEEPHAVGWRFVTERRAIDLNPACGWAQGKADVLYVADAFEVMEKVNQLLRG
jgi:electron transfer flavoprotein alpha subunit